MKRITSILIVSTTILLLNSCGGSLDSKLQGKWQWLAAEKADGSEPLSMTGQQYFLFKGGKYLYLDYSSGDATENWDTNSLPYKLDSKTKLLTIMSTDGHSELKHYKVGFKDKNTLLLTVDDAGEFYGEVWRFKKM